MSTPSDPDDREGGDSEWRFGLDDVDGDGIVTPDPEPIEPERVDPVNAAFVVMGAVGTVLVLLSATL